MADSGKHLGKYTSLIYDPKKHPQLLIDIFEKGGEVCNFAGALNISERTFFLWLKIYPELMDAYEIAKAKAKIYLTAVGIANLESNSFQFNVWSLLMRNRCKTTEHRTVPIDFSKCKTSNAKLKVLEKELAEGNLTPMEAKCFAEVIKAGAEINEKTDVAVRLDEVLKNLGKG